MSFRLVDSSPNLFRNAIGETAGLQAFEHPAHPAPKTLVLESGFQSTASVRISSGAWGLEKEPWAPASLAASPDRLRTLAPMDSRPRLTHSIVGFIGVHLGLFTQEDRDLLWRSFGVPVYEQFLGLGGEVLASECDAHDGLHIREDAAIFEEAGGDLLITSLVNLDYPVLRLRTGFGASIVTRLCGCGETSPRLVGLTRLEVRAKAHAAGYPLNPDSILKLSSAL